MKAQTLLDLFSTQALQISLPLFVANLLLSALLAWILGRIYVKFGTTLSNREQFGRNFMLVTTTTMLIITIVKSSLALSLGLVGALSIIRFRAAIKEPEELSYLFLAISVGLGLGAEQTVITTLAFFVMLGILTGRHWVRRREERPNLYLTVTCPAPRQAGLPQILAALKSHTTAAGLKRFDQTPELLEASFQVQFDSVARLDACSQELRKLGDGVRVSYLEQATSASEGRLEMSGVPENHRYERKFALAGTSLAEVEHRVRHHPALFFQEYAPRTVNNIYFDSPDLRNYCQNIDGHSHRAKLRARWYGRLFGKVPQAVLEQKCKLGHVGMKVSARLAPFDVGPTVGTREVRGWLEVSSLPENLAHEVRQAEPTLVNHYRRQYFRSADRQVRLTIDSDLTFFRFQRQANPFLSPVLAPTLIVLELKYSDAAGAVAASVANALPFRMTRMSKYVFGLQAVGAA